jgi:ADP-ribose pyrophosphatase
MEPWKIEQQQRVFDGYVKIEHRRYRMPDGRVSDWDVIEGSRTVAAVARTTDGSFIVVRQFRVGPNRVLGEVPGGYVDHGEDVLEAAARELREETGYVAGSMTILARTWLSARAEVERFIVFADHCTIAGAPTPDRDEITEVVLLDPEDFAAHIRTGEMTDMDAGLLALDHLGLL